MSDNHIYYKLFIRRGRVVHIVRQETIWNLENLEGNK